MHGFFALFSLWASAWDFGTYRISEQRMLRRVYAYVRRLARAFAARLYKALMWMKAQTKIQTSSFALYANMGF